MKPSEQAKIMGLKSLKKVSELTGVSTHTLANWSRDKPKLFKTVLMGCLNLKPLNYGDWIITYDPLSHSSPFSWSYNHKDFSFDGIDNRYGSAESLKECIVQINSLLKRGG